MNKLLSKRTFGCILGGLVVFVIELFLRKGTLSSALLESGLTIMACALGNWIYVKRENKPW